MSVRRETGKRRIRGLIVLPFFSVVVCLPQLLAQKQQKAVLSDLLDNSLTTSSTTILDLSAAGPLEIYTTQTSQIRMRVRHGPSEKVRAFLDDRELATADTPATTPGEYLLFATVPKTVAVALNVGAHILTLSGGTLVGTGGAESGPAQTRQISIKGPINASVKDIEPNWVMRYWTDSLLIKIHGTNLRDIHAITLEPVTLGPLATGGKGYTSASSKNDTEIDIRTDVSPYVTDDAGVYANNTILFNDGSKVKLPPFSIYNRVAPWNAGSWISFFSYQSLFLAIWATMYWVMAAENHQIHLKNKTAPGFGASMGLFLAASAATIICVGGAALIWSALSNFSLAPKVSFTFLAATALVGLNIALPTTFVDLTGKFQPVAPLLIRWVLGGAFMFSALAVPFLMTPSGLSPRVIPVEMGILAGTMLLGGAGTERVRRQLISKRRLGPEDSVIDGLVEESLFSKGRAVFRDDLHKIPRDRVKQAFLRFIAAHPNDLALELIDDADDLQLRFVRHALILQISSAFKACREGPVEANIAAMTEALSRLADAIRTSLGFDSGDAYRTGKLPPGFFVASSRPTGLESVLPDPFPIIITAFVEPFKAQQLADLQSILNALDTKTRFALAVSVNNPSLDREAIQTRLGGIGRENIVVIGERELLRTLGGNDPIRQAFMDSVQRQVDLSVFSPYTVEGPTPIDMFYGRRGDIETILDRIPNGSVAVLGARRIGKTSILQAAQRVLLERGRLLLYLDCYSIGDYETFLMEAASRWRISSAEPLTTRNFRSLPNWIINLQSEYPDKQIVVQLDEIDRLLDYDVGAGRDERLFRMLRSLAQEKRCQFIFSGERTLLDKLSDPSSSFFNFVTPVYLDLLDLETSRKIVYEPMRLIGVALESDSVIDVLYDHTSGHPNLIQFVCRQCLSILSKQRKRILTTETLAGVLNSSQFREQYLLTFWSQATWVEKAMSICAVDRRTATLQGFLEYLTQAGFSVTTRELRRGCKYLTLIQLLESNSDVYSIKPAKFADALAGSSLAEWLIEFLVQWQAEKDKTS